MSTAREPGQSGMRRRMLQPGVLGDVTMLDYMPAGRFCHDARKLGAKPSVSPQVC